MASSTRRKKASIREGEKQALTMSEDGIGGAVATTEASAKHQNLYAVAGALCFFLHQSDKWHNEATPLNVREPSVALPVGLCRMAEGGNT